MSVDGSNWRISSPISGLTNEGRRAAGLTVEKKNSIFAKGGYTDKEAKRNILANPFKRFEDMQMLRHTKTLGIVQVDESV